MALGATSSATMRYCNLKMYNILANFNHNHGNIYTVFATYDIIRNVRNANASIVRK